MNGEIFPSSVIHWNYRGFTEFPMTMLKGEETDIYLKENLIATIPNEIDRLSRLESLYLSGNDITELPKEVAKLRRLKCLDVSGNRLKRIPEEIGDARSLRFLILDDNELRELPLRLAELRALRYLSVCDNKLKWLPQRPVFNYFHCEFRFWRNTDLKTIPYTLWYHMFRDQQTRSLNIGCLKIPQFQHLQENCRCRLKLQHNSRTWDVDIQIPDDIANIFEKCHNNPPTLLELSKRKFYDMISAIAKKVTNDNFSLYTDNIESVDRDNNNNNLSLQELDLKEITKSEPKDYFVPLDVIEEYFDYLPKVLRNEMARGPVSRCENVQCKKPLFDFVTYEFCLGKLVLIDETEDIILSAAFCSHSCANVWKGGKTNIIIPWNLTF